MANDADNAYDSLNYQEPYSAGYASMWEETTFGEKRLFEISRLEGQPLGLTIVDYPIEIIVQSVQEGSPADLDGLGWYTWFDFTLNSWKIHKYINIKSWGSKLRQCNFEYCSFSIRP